MNRITGYSSRELFTDREMVESFRNVVFRLHHPERCNDYFAPEHPYASNISGAGTIIRLPEGRWRMYFRGGYFLKEFFDRKTSGQACLYAAESDDGIHWDMVTKESIVRRDSFEGHIVNVEHATVFYDTNPAAPADEKFKMLFIDEVRNKTDLTMAVSGDGLNFRLKRENRFEIESQYDTQNILFWDERIQKYRIYTRIRRFGKRGIRMHLTEDFFTFSNATDLVFRNDSNPDTQLYTNCVAPYVRSEKFWLGFPIRYCDHGQVWTHSQLYPPGVERRVCRINGTKYTRVGTVATDPLFMSSRNGWIWDRRDESFLRPGPCTEGSWFYGDNYVFHGMLTTKSGLGFGAPDEFSFYTVENYMNTDGSPVRFRRWKLRQDGFVSAHFGEETGELTTKPFLLTEDSLSLNLETSAWGLLTVEILDEDGNVINGFGKKDMYPIYGDSLDIRPMWKKSGSCLAKLKGKMIALRFTGRDADLYSYAHVPYRKDPELPKITEEAKFEPVI